MGILILKKACYGAIVKVFVLITVIKTIIMTLVNSDNNNSINNNNNNNNNNDHVQKLVAFWESRKNVSSTNDVSRSKFQHVVHLCKSTEYGTLIFKNCAVSEVSIEKYVGSV